MLVCMLHFAKDVSSGLGHNTFLIIRCILHDVRTSWQDAEVDYFFKLMCHVLRDTEVVVGCH